MQRGKGRGSCCAEPPANPCISRENGCKMAVCEGGGGGSILGKGPVLCWYHFGTFNLLRGVFASNKVKLLDRNHIL